MLICPLYIFPAWFIFRECKFNCAAHLSKHMLSVTGTDNHGVCCEQRSHLGWVCSAGSWLARQQHQELQVLLHGNPVPQPTCCGWGSGWAATPRRKGKEIQFSTLPHSSSKWNSVLRFRFWSITQGGHGSFSTPQWCGRKWVAGVFLSIVFLAGYVCPTQMEWNADFRSEASCRCKPMRWPLFWMHLHLSCNPSGFLDVPRHRACMPLSYIFYSFFPTCDVTPFPSCFLETPETLPGGILKCCLSFMPLAHRDQA